ncbi:MAG: carboxylating nicotinate-nucleotide diphosphorylase [Candidatus Stahlbacteria bacterium]|nr:carboxylating nicotinate-nucleotide diphosphorylase [Candidatus Stahlbacteria bacterium]
MMLKRIVKLALLEDIGKGDITTTALIPSTLKGNAVIIAKEEGVLAGGNVAYEVFRSLDTEIRFEQVVPDGSKFKFGSILFNIEGKIAAMITGERTALNFLQHLSGVATLTSKFVEKVAGTGVKIIDTRKTIPGLRGLEKYAVKCGGGENHRMGLWDMILIKDNHIMAAGGIKEAISKCKMQNAKCKTEVEVKSLDELDEVIKYPIDRVMLDNMSITQIKEAVKKCKMQNAKCKIEVSGGVNLDNVREIAEAGVGYISVGALTHSAPAIDISLKVKNDINDKVKGGLKK